MNTLTSLRLNNTTLFHAVDRRIMCQPLLKHNICSTEVVREAFSGLDAISYIAL